MPNGNNHIEQPQFSIPHSSYTVSLPYASEIERTMSWLDKIAQQHYWTTEYSSDPLITPSGFNWKRHNGVSLEPFIPLDSGNYRLTGYPINSEDFWERCRTILQFVGDKTLRYYDLYGGNTSSLTSNRITSSGYRWKTYGDDQWKTYGDYTISPYSQNLTLGDSTENSYVDYHDSSKTKYMLRHGKLSANDYKQYTPTTLDQPLQFFGPYSMVRRGGYNRLDHLYDGINSFTYIGDGPPYGIYSSNNSLYDNSDWTEVKMLTSGQLNWVCDNTPSKDNGTRCSSYYNTFIRTQLMSFAYYAIPGFNFAISGRQVELHELGAAFEESFSFLLLPLSRKCYSSGTYDSQHYNDDSHYLSSFTGFSIDDNLEHSYKIINLALSGIVGVGLDSSGYYVPLADCVPLEPNTKLIYGYIDFDPVINSGYFSSTNLVPLNGYDVKSSVGNAVLEKILSNNYTEIFNHSPLSYYQLSGFSQVGTPHIEMQSTLNYNYNTPYPTMGETLTIPPIDLTETDISGYATNANGLYLRYGTNSSNYSYNNSVFGSMSGVVRDFYTPGNVLFLAFIQEPFDRLQEFMNLSMPSPSFYLYSGSGQNPFYGAFIRHYNSYYVLENGSGLDIPHSNTSYAAINASDNGYKNSNNLGDFGRLYSDTKLYDVH